MIKQHDEIRAWLSGDLRLPIEGDIKSIEYDDKEYSWGKRIFLCSFRNPIILGDSAHSIVDIRFSVNRDIMSSNLIDFYYDDVCFSKLIGNNNYTKIVIYILGGALSEEIFLEAHRDKNCYENRGLIWVETEDKYIISKDINKEKIGYVQVDNIPSAIVKKFKLDSLLGNTVLNTKSKKKQNNKGNIACNNNIILSNSRYEYYLKLRDNGYSNNDYSSKISVITAVYNNVALIEQTIQSVINQNNKNIEHIVIDGGSTDGTVDIIKKYDSRIDYWISEPDEGIYDAMNKGIALSKGNWLIFINSDDLLASPESLDIDLEGCSNSAIAGRTLMLGDYYNWTRPVVKKKSIYRYSHQALLTKKQIFYDLSYQVASDNDYLGNYASSFEHTDKVISIFRMGGYSTDRVTMLQIKERYNVSGFISMSMLFFRLIFFHLFGKRIIEIVRVIKNKYI